MVSAVHEVAWLFLKLGTIGFGGPAAHIALMESEVVRRRGWLSREEFLDLLGATNLIPGPNSTEMAIHIGYRRAGWLGLIVAGACFILPATVIVTATAWAYVRFGSMPQVAAVFHTVKPVIVAVVVQALWGLGKTAMKTPALVAIALAGVILSAFGIDELLVLAAAAAAGVGCSVVGRRQQSTPIFSVELGTLFFFFLKVGSVLFGSGYVLLAFLRGGLVERWGWLTETQLLDAISVGQVTPGPVFTTATFIGYVLAGVPGAVVATIGIFLPAFVFVALSGPLIPRIRRSPLAGSVLDGINVGSLALMAVVTFQLGKTAIIDVPTALLGLGGLLGLFVFRLNPTWLVAGAVAFGLLKSVAF